LEAYPVSSATAGSTYWLWTFCQRAAIAAY